jgi:hypothetical protein
MLSHLIVARAGLGGRVDLVAFGQFSCWLGRMFGRRQ